MKRRAIALFLCVLMLVSIAAPCASAASADAHSNHVTQLEEILTGENCETDFCGRFYCEDCQESYYAPISYADIGMPIINLKGSLAGISKENKVTVDVDYSSAHRSFSSSATLNVQGGSSAGYPKKNYTVQFLKADGSKNKISLVDSWGKQSKYCLKANWVDFSQARNVVAGKLFNQIVHSRFIDDELNALPNGGVVDGYPVLMYLNGDLLGLYTLNIPKDNWMFGMNDETVKQALLFGNDWTASVAFANEISNVNDVGRSGWEIEYCSTEDDPEIGTAWVGESMNELIRFVMNSDDETFKNGISAYTDVDRAIDAMLYISFTHAIDNMAKNIIWASYDGVKWIPSVYDLDATWGLYWDGSFGKPATDLIPDYGANISYVGHEYQMNRLFARLYDNFSEEICARYVELREDILSESNVFGTFEAFFAGIPQLVYTAEGQRWPSSPSHSKNNMTQIMNYMKERIAYLDEWFGVTINEKADSAYKASFNAPAGVKVLVYPSQDYSETPVQAWSAFSVTKDGELTKTDGQINFTVVPPEGYAVASVTATPGNYKNIKGPADTELENTWRITKMTGDITVNIELQKIGADPEPEGYNVSFVCDHAKVYIYPCQDYTYTPALSSTAVSVDSDSGVPTKSGDGQVNFLVVPDEGYELSSVTAEPKNYKNIKGSEDTGLDNVYRITKISGDFTVNIKAEMIPPTLSLSASAEKLGLGKTVTFTASVENLPDGAYIAWNVSGSKSYTVSADTMSCTVTAKSVGTVKVTATLVNADGSPISDGVTSASASAKVALVDLSPVENAFNNAVTAVRDSISGIVSSLKTFAEKFLSVLK